MIISLLISFLLLENLPVYDAYICTPQEKVKVLDNEFHDEIRYYVKGFNKFFSPPAPDNKKMKNMILIFVPDGRIIESIPFSFELIIFGSLNTIFIPFIKIRKFYIQD